MQVKPMAISKSSLKFALTLAIILEPSSFSLAFNYYSILLFGSPFKINIGGSLSPDPDTAKIRLTLTFSYPFVLIVTYVAPFR